MLSLIKLLYLIYRISNLIKSNTCCRNPKKLISRGHERALSSMISFILTLLQLKINFNLKHLMCLLKTSEKAAINTIFTLVNFMYIKLGSLCIWPNASQVKKNMPNSMIKKISKNQMYYRICSIQNSSTFVNGIRQINVF